MEEKIQIYNNLKLNTDMSPVLEHALQTLSEALTDAQTGFESDNASLAAISLGKAQERFQEVRAIISAIQNI